MGRSLVTHLSLFARMQQVGKGGWFFQCPCKSQIDLDTGPAPQGIVDSVLSDQLVPPEGASSKAAGCSSREGLLERRICSHHCSPSGVLAACRGSAPGEGLSGERTISDLQVTGIGHIW